VADPVVVAAVPGGHVDKRPRLHVDDIDLAHHAPDSSLHCDPGSIRRPGRPVIASAGAQGIGQRCLMGAITVHDPDVAVTAAIDDGAAAKSDLLSIGRPGRVQIEVS